MKLVEKIRYFLARCMSGRHGADDLGMFTLLTGVLTSLLGSITRFFPLSILGFALYVITLFRMFSRNHDARYRENRRFLELTGNYTIKTKQFFRRIKNRKEYKYCKCPKCKQLLRMKRGCGEIMITCAKCGHQFSQKA